MQQIEITTSSPHRSDASLALVPPTIDEAVGESVARSNRAGDTPDVPWYRREAWLAAALVGLLPVCIGMALPQAWRIPLSGVTGLLLALSVFLMIRKQRGEAAQRPER